MSVTVFGLLAFRDGRIRGLVLDRRAGSCPCRRARAARSVDFAPAAFPVFSNSSASSRLAGGAIPSIAAFTLALKSAASNGPGSCSPIVPTRSAAAWPLDVQLWVRRRRPLRGVGGLLARLVILRSRRPAVRARLHRLEARLVLGVADDARSGRRNCCRRGGLCGRWLGLGGCLRCGSLGLGGLWLGGLGLRRLPVPRSAHGWPAPRSVQRPQRSRSPARRAEEQPLARTRLPPWRARRPSGSARSSESARVSLQQRLRASAVAASRAPASE